MITKQETIERAIVRDLQALRHVIPGHRITRNKGGSNATIHINFHRRTDMICDRVSSAIRALFRGAGLWDKIRLFLTDY